jgi:flagellar basal-body rod protein FlgF
MDENLAYVALSKQMAMRRELDVIANNLANMNTTAYRANRVLFEEYLSEVGSEDISYVQDVAVIPNLRAGNLQQTGNPLDVAISGPGYFVVQGDDDGERYTRNGHMRTDAEGRLVTVDGRAVLDENRQPILIPAEEERLTVRADGAIVGGDGVIGKLALVSFANEYALNQVGNSQYETDEVPQPADDASVKQGVVETSNVDPILEMTQMTELLRAYQSVQDILERGDQLRRTSIQKLGTVA